MANSRRFQTRVLCVALYVGLLSCCQAVQVTDRVFQWIRNPENYTTDGVRLTGSVLKTVYMRYVMIQCAFECLREPECRSFNWYPLNHCQLNSASHLAAPDNMTQDVRYEYHLRDAFSIDQEALGPCSGNPCGTHGQCMETMSADLDLQAICICDIGWRGSKCDLPEAAPQWGEWGVWAPCSVSCGLGVTSRRRPCEDVITNVSIDVRECYGADVEFKSCTEPACPRWGVWGAWGSCSTETTCGQGVKVRTRNCTNGGTAGVDRYCLGPTNQTSPCSAMDCRGLLRLVSGFQPGEGRLEVFSDVTEQWGGVCSAALTPATADLVCRQLGFPGAFQATADLRFGAPAGMPFGLTSLTCRGGERSLLECAHNTWSQAASCPDGTSTPAGVLCNVDGSWTLWSAWSACSVTCENGTSTRTRTCTHPPALHAGKPCAGNDLETKPCSLPDCPGWEPWGPWSAWSACDMPCGTGQETRTRSCTTGNASDCTGPYVDFRTCETGVTCSLVDGEWLQWSTWSSCSETCGEGTQFRSRTCANPLHGGKECTGNDKDQRGCYDRECPVDGTWKTWELWGACSRTCGGGERSRSRECVLPKFGGQFCLGDTLETEACSTQQCPVDGVWNTWGAWSQCNVTCGGGHQKRMRTCQPPQFGGNPCPGSAEESRVCNDFLCPEDGMWMPWSSWSSCTATCGGAATRSRERTCKTSLGSTKQCEGDSRQTESCSHGPCPIDGYWLQWQSWEDCNATCGGGTRQRVRQCQLGQYGGANCSGTAVDLQVCNLHECPVDGVWRPWGSWGSCSLTCGSGVRVRRRTCDGPSFGGRLCEGSSQESELCNVLACPVDGVWAAWAAWSACSQTCGDGWQERARDCQGPFHGGLNCSGPSSDSQACFLRPCPVDGAWGGWAPWTACPASCGGSVALRTRECLGPRHGGQPCAGVARETLPCHGTPCPIDGFWLPWSSWSPCPVTCGEGQIVRSRLCHGPFNGGRNCSGSWRESSACAEKPCPLDGVWLPWTSWPPCPVTCGGGQITRSRSCNGTLYGGRNCSGAWSESQQCGDSPCPIDGVWLAWTSWQPCPVTCGGGQTTRSRSCNGPFHGGHNCSGAWSEMEECGDSPCPFDGVWNPWSDWSACPVTCGGSTTTRSRTCQGPLHEGKNCSGSWKEVKDCGVEPCPVDGDWKPWGEWSVCSDTCGGGTQTRQRACLEAMFGGRPCTGPTTEQRSCNSSPCPEDGVFMPWSSWGTCDVTCGGGTRMRERTCDGPRYGGKNCSGLWRETEACSADNCPVDGVIGPWEAWTDCSVTCGGGSRSRYRNCTGPFHGGQPCTEARNESEACATDDCPVDGQWRTWSPWGDCSVSCGGGTRMRNRTCNGPFHGGRPCEGESRDSEGCNDRPCPVDGYFDPWSSWGECDVTCGGGSRWRSRICVGPFHGGADCAGARNESEACNTHNCPVDGVFQQWQAWGACSVSCGGGARWRSRGCEGPLFGGAPCQGAANMSSACNEQPCPVDGVLGPWSQWSQCSLSCGSGLQWRNRSCQAPLHGGSDCAPERLQSQSCNTQPCPVDGVLGPWSEWSQCSLSCGSGLQWRNRSCQAPLHGGSDCAPERLQSQSCNTQPCPVDGYWLAWAAWGHCSTTCGGGVSVRMRACQEPKYGGAPCEGATNETRSCSENPCPIPGKWHPWATWSACSVTCGGGIRNRSRECDMTSYGDLTAPCAGPDSESETCHEYECTPLVRTCSEWGERGLRDSTVVEVDPDGEDLLDPVKVYCDMAADGGIGVTVIGHDNEDRIQVVGYEGAGEFSVVLNYNVTYFRHAEAIVDASDNCRQFIRWECKASLIHNPNGQGMVTTGWRNRTGEIADYFGGASPGSGKCACGMTRSCADPAQVCNCDKNDNVWREDSGFLTYKQDLPVKEFIAGDTGEYNAEVGFLTVGAVYCWGVASLV